MALMLQVEGLTKQVHSLDKDSEPLVLLQDINFSIDRGESVALVGPSGSGKSTLLGLLAGLDDPSAGRVLIDEESIFDLDEDGRARLRGEKIGFIFQSFQLLANLTALENVLLPLEIAGHKQAASAARATLERVGLGARLRHYPRQLSGGEQQRVAIARAFVMQPALLLADEPTGNLDSQTGGQIISLLFELNRERGTTLVMVTHDNALAALCGRQLHMSGGRLQG